MERQMLIRNIAYMERELSAMKKELVEMDAKLEQQEGQVYVSHNALPYACFESCILG